MIMLVLAMGKKQYSNIKSQCGGVQKMIGSLFVYFPSKTSVLE